MQISEEHPICLIEVVEYPKNSEKPFEFKVNPDALEIIEKIRNQMVAPIAVFGPHGSGKSFLCNQILKRMSGFESVGTAGIAKGIWMWSRPIQTVVINEGKEEHVACILLDCEGLDQEDSGTELSQALVSLLTLISSILIYNQRDGITSQSLSKLSSLLRQLDDIKDQNKHHNGDHINEDFPQFLWILRDFGKDLGLQTSEDYMEKCLTDLWEKTHSIELQNEQQSLDDYKDINLKDLARSDKDKHLIKDLFDHRSCFTLPSPVEDPSKLKSIFKLDEGDLTSEFTQNMKNFLQYMSLNINPKKLNHKSMTGNIFQNFLFDLVSKFNDIETPMINEMAATLFDYEARTILDEIILNSEQYSENFKEYLPTAEIELHKRYDEYIKETILEFTEKTEKLSSVHTYATNQEYLLKKLTDNLDSLVEINVQRSKAQAESSLNDFIAHYTIPNVVDKGSLTKEIITNMKNEFLGFIEQFLRVNIGPGSSEKCLQVLPGFLFETLSSIYSRVIDVFSGEVTELSNSLELANGSQIQMKDYLKTQENSVVDLTREKNKLANEVEQLRHDLDRLARNKESEVMGLNDRISKFEEQVEKKKMINDSLNNDYKDLQDNFLEANDRISSMQREIDQLYKRNDDSEKLIMEYSKTLQMSTSQQNDNGANVDSNIAASSTLYQTIKHLAKQVESLQNSIKSRNTSKIARMSTRLANKDKEIQTLLNSQQTSLTTLRTTYTSKINSLKELYEARILSLTENLENVQSTLKSTKTQLFESQKSAQKAQKVNLLNQELNMRIKTLESSIQAKDTKSEINQETFTKFIKQIETIKLEKSGFEEKLMEWKEQGLKATHEINNVINCVNNVSQRSMDRNLITHLIRKLDKESVKKLRPFFGTYKIKV